MTRTGSSNHFWLQSVINAPMVLFEEPLITSADVHDWKLLLEGSEYTVHIKNAPDQIMGRLPFFLTSNHDVWKYVSPADGNALKERIITYRFYTQINNDPQNINDRASGRFSTAPRTVTPADVYYFFTRYIQ
jgi:hypothetical protein